MAVNITLAVIAFSAAICVVCLYVDRRRRRHFQMRVPVEFDRWFELHFESSDRVSKDFTGMLLHELGQTLGVAPTQILPSDSIDDDLSLPPNLLMDDVDCVIDDVINEFASTRHIGLSRQLDWHTVHDLIIGISSVPTFSRCLVVSPWYCCLCEKR